MLVTRLCLGEFSQTLGCASVYANTADYFLFLKMYFVRLENKKKFNPWVFALRNLPSLGFSWMLNLIVQINQ